MTTPAAKARMQAARKVRRKIAALKTWKREGLRLKPSHIELREPRGSRGAMTYGRAARTGYVVVGKHSTPEYTAQVILHEFTHVALYRLAHPKRRGHGNAFRQLLLAAAEEFWQIDREQDGVLELWEARKGTDRVQAYDLDWAIVQAVTRKMDQERKAASAPSRKAHEGLDVSGSTDVPWYHSTGSLESPEPTPVHPKGKETPMAKVTKNEDGTWTWTSPTDGTTGVEPSRGKARAALKEHEEGLQEQQDTPANAEAEAPEQEEAGEDAPKTPRRPKMWRLAEVENPKTGNINQIRVRKNGELLRSAKAKYQREFVDEWMEAKAPTRLEALALIEDGKGTHRTRKEVLAAAS